MELFSGELTRGFTNYDERIEAGELWLVVAKELSHTSFQSIPLHRQANLFFRNRDPKPGSLQSIRACKHD